MNLKRIAHLGLDSFITGPTEFLVSSFMNGHKRSLRKFIKANETVLRNYVQYIQNMKAEGEPI